MGNCCENFESDSRDKRNSQQQGCASGQAGGSKVHNVFRDRSK
jgi:hypothetical protein